MNQFVGVRMVKANSMDLTLFQFDYDMTFTAFFMHPDKTIYGRYGTRSEYKQAAKEMSLPGFRKALEAALALHRDYPNNKRALAGKTGPRPKQKIPEDFATLKNYRPKLDYGRNVVKSCLHCHQVRDARRNWLRAGKKPATDADLFPYPMPDVVGLTLDPQEKARVKRVQSGSPAARAGFRAGDDIATLDGQPIISIADIQWVLHNAKSRAALKADVRRQGRSVSLTLSLPTGWRRQSDIRWRASTWEMNRLVGGSLKWENLTTAERKKLGLTAQSTAIRVAYVGWWGKYQAGKRAGFRKGDVMISFNGQRRLKSVNEFYAYAMNKTKRGQRVTVEVLRSGRKLTLKLPMQ